MLKLLSILLKNLNVNPLSTNVPHHIETSQLVCSPNQLWGTLVENGLMFIRNQTILNYVKM